MTSTSFSTAPPLAPHHAAFDAALAIIAEPATPIATILRLESAGPVTYTAVAGRPTKARLLTLDGRDYIARPYCRVSAP